MLMLLERIGPPGRGSGCGRRPFFFFNDTATTEIYTLSLHDALPILLSLRHFGLVLFIPWRVGAEESGAAKNGLRAQHLNNALTECLKWRRVNLLCHGRARASFSLTLRAGAMLLEPIFRLGVATASVRGAVALIYPV